MLISGCAKDKTELHYGHGGYLHVIDGSLPTPTTAIRYQKGCGLGVQIDVSRTVPIYTEPSKLFSQAKSEYTQAAMQCDTLAPVYY